MLIVQQYSVFQISFKGRELQRTVWVNTSKCRLLKPSKDYGFVLSPVLVKGTLIATKYFNLVIDNCLLPLWSLT